MPQKRIITGQHVIYQKQVAAEDQRRRMTPAEAKLWRHLQGNRLGGFHFRRQQIIDRFIVDFYCHQSDLVVEVDGGIHKGQEDYDRARDQYLQERGLKVLRFSNAEVTGNLEKVLETILEACQCRSIHDGH